MNPTSSRGWLKLLLLICAVGMVKAGAHLLKIMMLGLLGLAGMWMLHKLAQDYSTIRKGVTAAKAILRLKRESVQYIGEEPPAFVNNQTVHLDWNTETILRLDPKGCVKSFVCQEAALSNKDADPEESKILRLLTVLETRRDWASEELRKAADLGTRLRDVAVCRKQYRKCPFSAGMMLSLMNAFGPS